jgi:hypothetical protein
MATLPRRPLSNIERLEEAGLVAVETFTDAEKATVNNMSEEEIEALISAAVKLKETGLNLIVVKCY